MNGIDDRTQTVDLSEYEQLRGEINNRTRLSAGLVGLQLAALGAGLSAINSVPDVVVALAIVSSFLWLLWIDHTSQIYKIGAYIALGLAPRLRLGDRRLLGWEQFLRAFEKDPDAALGGSFSSSAKVLRTHTIGTFIFLLFGGSSLLLIVGFVAAKHRELFHWNAILSLRGSILLLASVAWIYAWSRYSLFVRMRRRIDERILQGQETGVRKGQPDKAGTTSA